MKKSFVFFGVLSGLLLILFGTFNPSKEQQLTDDIVALVDDHPILKSDLEGYYKSNFDSKYYFVLFDPRIKPDINPLAFLRNNHLNYSITWFLLSLSSVIMVLIIRRKHNG